MQVPKLPAEGGGRIFMAQHNKASFDTTSNRSWITYVDRSTEKTAIEKTVPLTN